MIELKAHAKINWALWIKVRRPDGYHELDMLMQRIALCDRLKVEEAEETAFYVDGEPSRDQDNLVLRAANALRRETGVRRGARIFLEKRIPARAGLGGGSADCAAALTALNRLWGLGLSDGRLQAIGLRLGADVPYCLAGGLCRVGGIGEAVQRFAKGPVLHLAMARLGDGLSTADVFRAWDENPSYPPVDAPGALSALLSGDFDGLRALAHNALTTPASRLMPEIPEKIAALYAAGARYAQMSGSGSTVYGVFARRDEAERAARILGKNAIVTETMPR
jgi:4-diphosphocytidyl-2-C-methyl-D-erythritol kinase